MVETCDTRGRTFSNFSEDSMRKSCMPPTRSTGRMATAVTMMPMPPIRWRSARQSSRPFGCSARPTITVAPVVVRPDMASKKASAKLSSFTDNRNGRVEKQQSASQAITVSRKPSRGASIGARAWR